MNYMIRLPKLKNRNPHESTIGQFTVSIEGIGTPCSPMMQWHASSSQNEGDYEVYQEAW